MSVFIIPLSRLKEDLRQVQPVSNEIQQLLVQACAKGSKGEVLILMMQNIVIMQLKKQFPDNWQDIAVDLLGISLSLMQVSNVVPTEDHRNLN